VHRVCRDTPSRPISTADGDIAADALGFNRGCSVQQLGKELQGFSDRAWQRWVKLAAARSSACVPEALSIFKES
jgi:hypothetical protein